MTETTKPRAPAGYEPVGDRGATFDATRFGLGRVTFGEPTASGFARFEALHNAGRPSHEVTAAGLRACVASTSGLTWPKPEDAIDRWFDWFGALKLGAARALMRALTAYVDQLTKADETDAGNE